MPNPASITLGRFTLAFEPGGKLRQLRVGSDPILHETDYRMPLAGDRFFQPGGWDECCPSIDPIDGVPTMGLLIAHPPKLRIEPDAVLQTWTLPGWTARRTWTAPAPDRLRLDFQVEADGQARPFLWASHALFSVRDLVRVTLPDGRALTDFTADGTSSKSFVSRGAPIRLERRAVRLLLQTDQPAWGLWFNRGGWPAARPAGWVCLGIEATTEPADAPARGRLAAGESFHGSVELRIESTP